VSKREPHLASKVTTAQLLDKNFHAQLVSIAQQNQKVQLNAQRVRQLSLKDNISASKLQSHHALLVTSVQEHKSLNAQSIITVPLARPTLTLAKALW
jgi:hypothetical protein